MRNSRLRSSKIVKPEVEKLKTQKKKRKDEEANVTLLSIGGNDSFIDLV
jgi:hypothetical protein